MPRKAPKDTRGRARLIALRVSELQYAVLASKAAAKTQGNISKYARSVLFGPAPVLDAYSDQPQTTSTSRSRMRVKPFTIRLSEAEERLVERLARDGGYANRAAFIRARIFAATDVRLAGELGAIVTKIDEGLSYDPGGQVSADHLKLVLRRVRAALIAAGAVARTA